MPDPIRKGDTICFGDRVRVERGPRLLEAVATPEILHNDQTARHYFAGVRPEIRADAEGKPVEVHVPGVDALGKRIVLGEPMVYLDYGGAKAPRGDVWYIYQLTPRPVVDTGGKPVLGKDGKQITADDPNHWEEVDVLEAEEDAMAFAVSLAERIA